MNRWILRKEDVLGILNLILNKINHNHNQTLKANKTLSKRSFQLYSKRMMNQWMKRKNEYQFEIFRNAKLLLIHLAIY